MRKTINKPVINKLADVSSVNESQNRYQFPSEKNGTHEIEAKCASQPVQDGAQTVKSHGIQNATRGIPRGTRIVSVFLRRTQKFTVTYA